MSSILSIDQINVFDANGIMLYARIFKDEVQIDHNLLSAFFSAIRQFAAHVMDGEIQGIKVGTTLLNFKIIPFEDDHVIFLVVSDGFSEATAAENADDLAEQFAILLDQFIQENEITFTAFKNNINLYRGSFEDYYSPSCIKLVEEKTKLDTISLDLPVRVPFSIVKYIYEILSKNPALESLYSNGVIDILVENVQNFLHSEKFTDELKDKYS